MSKFTPLNFNDEEEDFEQHTRELQIESALTTLQGALELQKAGDWINTYFQYEELGLHDIMRAPNTAHNPIVDQLKYLLHRNRGMLQIRMLIENAEAPQNVSYTVHKKEIYNKLLGAIMDLVRATLFQDPDLKLIDILSSLFKHFHLFRLARLLYELKLEYLSSGSPSEDELIWDISKPMEILPDQISLMNDYLKFIDTTSDSRSELANYIQENVKSKRFWNAVYDSKERKWDDIMTQNDFSEHRKQEPELLIIDVGVTNNIASVDDVFNNLQSSMPKHKGKRKIFDGYLLTKNMVDKIKFEFSINNNINIEMCSDEEIVQEEPSERSERNEQNEQSDAVEQNEPNESNEPNEPTELHSVDIHDNEPVEVITSVTHESYMNSENHEIAATDGKDNQALEKRAIPENALESEHSDKHKTIESSQQNHTETKDGVKGSMLSQLQDFLQPGSNVLSHSSVKSKADVSNDSLQRKRNTRFKADIIKRPLTLEIFQSHDKFLTETIPGYIKLAGVEYDFQPMGPIIVDCKQDGKTTELTLAALLVETLLDWRSCNTESLTTPLNSMFNTRNNSAIDNAELVKEILTYSMNSSDDEEKKLFKCLDSGKFYELLQDMNNSNLHLFQVRIRLLDHLFTFDIDTYGTLLTNGKLGKHTIANIRSVLESVEMNLIKEFNKILDQNIECSSGFHFYLNKAISIFEILADNYLEIHQSLKLKSAKNKSRITETQHTEQSITKRIFRWAQVIEDLFETHPILSGKSDSKLIANLRARYDWTKIQYLQTTENTANVDILIEKMQEIVDKCDLAKIHVGMVNFNQLFSMKEKHIRLQMSKLKIMNQFTKHENTNDILERILFKETFSVATETQKQLEQELNKIISTSSFDLKLKLWSSLMKQYIREENIDKVQLSLETVLKLICDVIKVETLGLLKKSDQISLLLKCLGYFVNFTALFIKFVSQNDFQLVQREKIVYKDTLTCLSTIFQICYSYLMYLDSTSLTHGRKPLNIFSQRAYSVMNTVAANLFTLLGMYWEKNMLVKTNENINDFLSILHGELGARYICGAADGIFIQYLQHRLMTLRWTGSSNDIIQTINCRFGFSINSENFEPFDHKCKPHKMDENDAVELSDFIFSFCYSKKHPILASPRTDVKIMLDSIINVVATHEQRDSIISKNTNIIKSYLNETSIDMKYLLDAFSGKLSLSMEETQNEKFSVVKNGVYYLQACIALQSYKTRRRNMQSRVAELDYVIKMLQTDLVSGIRRLETWFLLGQTLSYLVEDDLLWTSDKMNSIDRRKHTAFVQKKSLLCYFMCVSIYFNLSENEKKELKAVLDTLWKYLAKEIFNSWYTPLNKLAYHVAPNESAKEMINNSFEIMPSEMQLDIHPNTLPNRVVVKLLEICFMNDYNDWYDLMYLSKSQMKLEGQELDYPRIIDYMLRSCQLAIAASNRDDPIVEPHYQLFSLIQKLYETKKIDTENAVKYLKRDPIFESVFEETFEGNFNKISIKILNKIQLYDKKNWQHQPVYKLAKLYSTYNKNFEDAVGEMLKIVNLKANVRTLTTIWKPDNERPGKHFVYTSKYTSFVCDLLFRLNDVHHLSLVVKKIRKLGSTMLNPNKVYDSAMTKLCILIKRITNMPAGFLDFCTQSFKYNDFTETSKEFLEIMKHKSLEDLNEEQQLLLYFLGETQSYKKITNGFGATSLIDEVFHSLYLLLYVPHIFDKFISKANDDISTIIQTGIYKTLPSSRPESSELEKSSIVERIASSSSALPTTIMSTNLEYSSSESDTSMVTAAETPLQNESMNHDAFAIAKNENANSKVTELTKGLTIQEKVQLMLYISPPKISNLNKEKEKLARRDISPLAGKLISDLGQVFEKLKEKFSNPLLLKFDLEQLTEEEFDALKSNVSFRQTREFKEEKDLAEYCIEHDRSLNIEELSTFNGILLNFSISTLENKSTVHEEEKKKLELEKIEDEKVKADLEAIRAKNVATQLEKQAKLVREHISLTQSMSLPALTGEVVDTFSSTNLNISNTTHEPPVLDTTLDLNNRETILPDALLDTDIVKPIPSLKACNATSVSQVQMTTDPSVSETGVDDSEEQETDRDDNEVIDNAAQRSFANATIKNEQVYNQATADSQNTDVNEIGSPDAVKVEKEIIKNVNTDDTTVEENDKEQIHDKTSTFRNENKELVEALLPIAETPNRQLLQPERLDKSKQTSLDQFVNSNTDLKRKGPVATVAVSKKQKVDKPVNGLEINEPASSPNILAVEESPVKRRSSRRTRGNNKEPLTELGRKGKPIAQWGFNKPMQKEDVETIDLSSIANSENDEDVILVD